eukprot:5689325-Alexandrium_andersonii.AAC.1
MRWCTASANARRSSLVELWSMLTCDPESRARCSTSSVTVSVSCMKGVGGGGARRLSSVPSSRGSCRGGDTESSRR